MVHKAVVVGALIVAVAGLPATATVLAMPPDHAGGGPGAGHPACTPGDVVDNEDLRIWFHGMKGQLQVFKKNPSGGNDGMYQYKTIGVEEQNDANETIATLNLERAHPQDSECEVEQSGDEINVTYTVEAPVRETDGGVAGTATVTFVYHFNESDSSAKFDLLVQEWPWQDDGQRLAYDFDVTSGEWEIERAENGLGFRDPDSGEAEASITWAPNATARYADGHEEEAIVDSNISGSDSHVHVDLAFTQASPGYVELDYDPSVAVGPYLLVGPVLVPLSEAPAPVGDAVGEAVGVVGPAPAPGPVVG